MAKYLLPTRLGGISISEIITKKVCSPGQYRLLFSILLTFSLLAATSMRSAAQRPTIFYAKPATYTVGTTITPLVPTSTNVAPPAYTNTPAIVGPRFNDIQDVAVDIYGDIYVANAHSSSIIEIGNHGYGPISSIGTGLADPRGVAVDALGDVFVADNGVSSIKEIYVNTQTPVTRGGLVFQGPTGVAVDAAGNIFVADNAHSLVKKILAGTDNTVTIGGSYAFDNPTSVAVDATGNVYVADANKYTVEQIAPDNTVKVIGPGGYSPAGIAVDAMGNVFLTAFAKNTVEEFPISGGPAVNIGANFEHPYGLATDAYGDVFVADNGHGKVKVIYPVGGYYISPALPPGLTFDSATGIISGTPTAPSPLTVYTISAYNAKAGRSTNVWIGVKGPGSDICTLKSKTLSTRSVTQVLGRADHVTVFFAGVDSAATSLTITPVATDPNATITINAIPVASGSPSLPIPLNVDGYTPITILVTAQDGFTTHTYGIIVLGTGSNNAYATIKGVKADEGTATVTPVFTSPVVNRAATTGYNITVDPNATNISFKPFLEDSTATIMINSVTAANDTTYGPMPLNTDLTPTVFDMLVTAQDGVTTHDYTITVTHATGTGEVVVNSALSPNGDGINDFLKINGIEAHPDNKLVIMNSNGEKVFVASGYKNTTQVFDGHSNITGKMQLPGSYFYSLQYTANGKLINKTGYIVLKY